MKIGIICAMEEEINSICKELNFANSTQFGEYFGHQIALVLSGIGKVNAAIYTQSLIYTFKPDYIINVGVAGGLIAELNFGDIVIANDLVYHDVDLTSFNVPFGQILRMSVFAFKSDEFLLKQAHDIKHIESKVIVGRIASGDQFVNDNKRAIFIRDEFNAVACEMEGAAIGHVCYINQVPFIAIRSISDKACHDNVSASTNFLATKDMVADRSSYIVKQLLERLA